MLNKDNLNVKKEIKRKWLKITNIQSLFFTLLKPLNVTVLEAYKDVVKKLAIRFRCTLKFYSCFFSMVRKEFSIENKSFLAMNNLTNTIFNLMSFFQ